MFGITRPWSANQENQCARLCAGFWGCNKTAFEKTQQLISSCSDKRIKQCWGYGSVECRRGASYPTLHKDDFFPSHKGETSSQAKLYVSGFIQVSEVNKPIERLPGFCQEKPTRLQIEAANSNFIDKLRNLLMQADKWTSLSKL